MEIIVLIDDFVVIFNPLFHFSLNGSILPFKPNAATFTAMTFYSAFIVSIFTCKDRLFTTAITVNFFILIKYHNNQLRLFLKVLSNYYVNYSLRCFTTNTRMSSILVYHVNSKSPSNRWRMVEGLFNVSKVFCKVGIRAA